jgi:hypothetical protein
LLARRRLKIARPWLYQGSKRHYKAVIEISKDFPSALSASQHTEP